MITHKPKKGSEKAEHELHTLRFSGPATYRIIVQGELEDHWSDRLAGMTVSHLTGNKGSAQTCLLGSIRDQAELSGVLETLHGLHMSIIKVEQVSDEFKSD